MSRRRSVLPAALWALAAGLLTFLAVESAVARRVGLDLLLPAADGILLPGRLARLGACMVLAFALALTDRGRALGGAVDRLCERDWGRWAVAAVCTGLFFVWALRVIVLCYMTNDDALFLQAIGRIPEQGLDAVRNTLAHSAQESTSSISILLCALIGFFYRLWPDGYWYLGFHLAMLFVSMTALGRCVLVRTAARRWPAWVGLLIHGAVCAGFLLCTLAELSFTVTPAVAGSAAAALLLCRGHETRRRSRVLSDVLSGLLILLCCMQRRATGYCLLCFWALAEGYALLRVRLDGGERAKKRLGGLCAAAAITLALAAAVFAAGRLECDENYRDAEHYRSLIVDFLNDDVTGEQYQRAGIPPELATLVHGWYFMDERVTTDMFRTVAENYYADLAGQPAVSLPARAMEAAGRLAGYIAGDGQMLWRTGCLLALLGLCAAAALRFGRRYWPELACAACAVGGAAILLLYLAKDGRFPLRVFLVVAIPACVTLLLTALAVPEQRPATPSGRRRAAACLGAICAAAAVVCCVGSLYTTPHAADTAVRADLFADQWAIEDYARAHSDTTIVTNMYEDYSDPLHVPADYPANRVLWGACGDTAKPAGERLYAGAFFRDDVLFMTDNVTAVMYLLQYLSLDWGPVQATVQDRVDSDICFYRLERLVPSPDYTGWLEQNGMTYYFRDGQALSGTRTIDGESYTFAAADAVSGFQMVPGGALTYTTGAYSLTTMEDAS